jgi:nitric oxide reductase subunit C
MSERAWRNVFIFGTLFFFAFFIVMTFDSLSQVESARTPPITEQVAAGKKVWQGRNCNDCHTILGIGGYFAPDLTKVADVRDDDWLDTFLTDPQIVKPGTTMPNQHLLANEAGDLVAFLNWVSGVDTNNWPPQPLGVAGGPGTAVSGALLVQQKGCLNCHRINERGAAGPGPDLSEIGSERDAPYISRYIENPLAVNPASQMPRIPMTGPERDAIAEYLSTMK